MSRPLGFRGKYSKRGYYDRLAKIALKKTRKYLDNRIIARIKKMEEKNNDN